MNVHDYRFLRGEQDTLRRLLQEISDSDVIGRMSLQARLEDVEARLSEYAGFAPRLNSIRLTFRGDPVLDQRGIQLDFSADSAHEFANVVTAMGSSLQAPLASTGRVRNAEQFKLAITGVSRGSFGFEIEEVSPQLAFADIPTPVEAAVEKVQEIFNACLGTDEELSEAISGTDRRALNAVQRFLKTVADAGAAFSLSRGDEGFSFETASQVRRSEYRLSEDNVKEDDVSLSVQFMGYFPYRPRAQFRIEGADAEFLNDEIGAIFTGPVETSVAEEVDINTLLNRDMQIDARVRRVGSSRPRFTVINIIQNIGGQLALEEEKP